MCRLVSASSHRGCTTKANNGFQLFNDTQTFRNEIKKAVLKFIHPGYDLFSPITANSDGEQLTAVRNKADHLLSTSSYLHGEPNAQVFQLIFRNCYALT